MAKDKFGFGTEESDSTSDQVVEASVKLINEFMPEIDKELRIAFVEGNLQTKTQLLQEYANDTDDRLWRSDEWMFLERALGKKDEDNYDYEHLKNMINTSYEDFKSRKPFYVPQSSWNEEWVDVYKGILTAASQKKGAPPPEELHQTLREM
jgi:hypothetical protein